MPSSRFVSTETGWPTIDIGALRHFVTILSKSDEGTFDAAGPVEEYTPFTSGWAAIEAVRGLDVIRGGQTTAQLYLVVAMWFQPGISSSMQVKHPNGSTYVIESAENVLEMGIVLVLNCVALGVNG